MLWRHPAVFDELNAMFSFGLERLDGQQDRARAASGQGSGSMDVQASLDLMQQLRDERMDAHRLIIVYLHSIQLSS